MLRSIPKPASSSEVVTIAILFALKSMGNQAFYRWLKRDHRHLFPQLPNRTGLFRLFNTRRYCTKRIMADPSLFGFISRLAYAMAKFNLLIQ